MLALLFQEANDVVVLWGVVFALHLVLVGGLAYRSGFLPRASGVLLIPAGGAYLARSFGTLVAPVSPSSCQSSCSCSRCQPS